MGNSPIKDPRFDLIVPDSNIIGTIDFVASSKGYYGQIELFNFPPKFNPSYKAITSTIAEPNYNSTLKEEALKLGQQYLDSLNGNFKRLEIDKGNKEYRPDYKISGTIVDKENETVIAGATITDESNDFSTKSEVDGSFILKGNYEIDNSITSSNPSLPPPAKPFKLTISSKPYNTDFISAVGLDGSIKSEVLGKLIPISSDTSAEVRNMEDYDKEQLKLLKQQATKDFVSTQVGKLFQLIKKLLIPAVVALIARFGISKLKELLDKRSISPKDLMAQQMSCPASIEELNSIIAAKNKLASKINKLAKGIDKINKFLKPINKLISSTKKALPAAKIAMNVIAFIPSTTFTPIPSGAFTKLSDALKALIILLNVEGVKITNGFFQLNMLQAKLAQLTNLMGILDMAIGICSQELIKKSTDRDTQTNQTRTSINPEPPTILPQTKISDALALSTNEMANQGTPVTPTVNGFTMEVINVDNVIIGGLKRRRAIAKDSFGVTVLKGEPSFSSNDQILVDELTFYIQQNNLKSGTGNTTSILNPDLEEE